MKSDTTTSKSRDILSNPLLASVWFCLPVIAIVATAQHDVGLGLRTTVWTVALSIMGAACITNAVRCGRTHCYITGPFFLVMAVLTLLYGVGVIPLGANGWSARSDNSLRCDSAGLLAGAVPWEISEGPSSECRSEGASALNSALGFASSWPSSDSSRTRFSLISPATKIRRSRHIR